jgi:hypothetical protein
VAYTLYPDGIAYARSQFDEQRGYATMYQYALAHSPDPGPGLSPLVRTGFAVLPCLSPADVAWLREMTLTADGGSRMASLSDDDLRALLVRLIGPGLDAAVKAEFHTPYAVVFAGPTDTRPETPGHDVYGVSYRWHCDGGPERHLKFIVYLDGPEAHDGATEVIEETASERLRVLGYGVVPTAQRLADLSEIAADHGLAPLPIHRLVPELGAGLLFNPGRIVHRGVAPTWGRRRVFTVGFVPFPEPWERTMRQFLPIIRQNEWFDFPAMTRPR